MALLILLPALAMIALLILIFLGSPVFFRQKRIGLHEKPFTIIKFRTMLNLYDAQGQLLPDMQRLTRFGNFLRSSSLDELPEFWNVLMGDMSVVGPRPLPPEYLPYYTPQEAMRHQIKPGITGWAQIHGRNSLTWEAKFAYDLWYLQNQNLWLDIKIVWMTFFKVIQREGIQASKQDTMPRLDMIRLAK